MATNLNKTDVVIVGLGAVGGVATLPLAQAGLEVIGLGAGGWLSPRDFAPDELRSSLHMAYAYWWNLHSSRLVSTCYRGRSEAKAQADARRQAEWVCWGGRVSTLLGVLLQIIGSLRS